MDRRRFLESLSATLATAGAISISASSNTSGKYKKTTKPVDIREVCNQLDRINHTIDQDDLFSVPSAYMVNQGADCNLFRESIKSMLLIGTIGDLSLKDQAHPKIQALLHENAGLFDRSILGMTTFLENTTKKQRKAVHETLKKDPDMLKAFQVTVDKEGRKTRVPDQRLTHMHTMFNRTSRALRRRNYSTTIDEIIEKVDRVAFRSGITPNTRRDLSQNWDEEYVVSLFNESQEYCGSNPIIGASSLQSGGDSGTGSRGKQRLRVGKTLMGVGSGMLSVGGFLIFVGLANGNFAWLPGSITGTVGAIVLISGIIVTAIGNDSDCEKESLNSLYEKSPAIQQKAQEAAEWVKKRHQTSDKSKEYHVLEAMEKFDLEFNEIWELLD